MPTTTAERTDLLETLNAHRSFLRQAAQGLTDAQAAATPTVSALSIGGIIKHVSATEAAWVEFIRHGPHAFSASGEAETRAAEFEMRAGDTLAALLDRYEAVANRTNQLVLDLPDLDASHPLPAAPWFQPGATRTARRTLLHIIAETAQHAGHADIIRETLDGAKTMG